MESISVFDIIKVGIGPSSSHTMGPWKAASMFVEDVLNTIPHEQIHSVKVHLFGSLAKTGIGHGTDIAVMMGLSGEDYTKINTDLIPEKVNHIQTSKQIHFGNTLEIPFVYEQDIIFHFHESLPAHPNGMKFELISDDKIILEKIYFSVGGGFVDTEDQPTITVEKITTQYPCHIAASIEKYCSQLNVSVSDLVYINEQAWRTKDEIDEQALILWKEIKDCFFRGIQKEGILPGGLNVRRRASKLFHSLADAKSFENVDELLNYIRLNGNDFTKVNKWVSCFALSINEENASFGRIVTAPTNGAAGVIPAVLLFSYCYLKDFNEKSVIRFLLTAGELGTLFKKNATISAAMGGCQAEIGVSSAMAAGALTESMGGSPKQVLMAAEIAMEHHLGLTCDPVGGLVQIPCIERNSMGAIKAITAANIAMESDPDQAKVSLDDVIKSMWDTAKDMSAKYKETSEGGLAAQIPVTLPEC